MLLPASRLHLIEQPGVKFRCIHCHTLLDKRSGDLTPFYVSLLVHMSCHSLYNNRLGIFQGWKPRFAIISTYRWTVAALDTFPDICEARPRHPLQACGL